MKNISWFASSSHRNKLLAVLAVFALVALMSGWKHVHAQAPAGAATVVQRHAEGLSLERRGDDRGAFIAFLDAAEHGHAPAQRKLGEIYDSGNDAVSRDYAASIRWYQKAREGGEVIPAPKSPMPILN